MKKLFLFVAMFLLASSYGYAQEWVGVNKSTPVRIQETLISSSEEEIVVDVKVAGFYQETVKTPNGKQFVISGEDMASMLIKGAPDLPMYPISMIIGDRAEMEVSVVKSNYVDFENIEVAPSKGNFSRQINPADVEYVYGEMYQQDAFYPAKQASLEAPYILRDFRGQNLMVYPYAYNPTTKTLRVYTELRLAVKKVSDNGENQKVTRRSNMISLDNETKASYERRFINFGNQSKYDFLVDEGEMLIICVDEYMEAVQPLVNWKNISGRPTTMVGVSETGTDTDMKTYVSNYYTQNPNLRYLLLVGEYNNLPPHAMNYNVKSDNFYGMLEGTDYYEEIFVGRLSVNSLADAQHQVGKIIHYERDIDETATWLSRAVGVAANEGTGHNGEADYVHMDYIRDTLMHYTITEMSQHYAYVNNPTASNMIADFNIGASVTNYCNHGSPDSWAVANFSNTHVHQLVNDQKLSYIWSVACNNGQFDYQECFAEAWMRATNSSTGEPTGAVGGMFSWISQPWVPPMYGQDEMVAILAEWRPGFKHTLGGASMNGNMFVLDMSPEDSGETHNSWLLFGDPSMMVRTKAPELMGVTAQPSTLLLGMTSLVVNADTDFGIATLSKDGEVIASAYVENGVAELEFTALSNVGVLQLVVVGYNKVTEIVDVEVIPAEGSYLVYDSHDINQADGQVDCAEDITLSLGIMNVGSDPTSDVSVTISSESEYVNISDATATIAAIGANELVTLENEFAFSVSPTVPDQTKIEFVVTCSKGTETWVSSFKITANAPLIEFKEFVFSGSFVPGETQTVMAKFENKGHYKATNALVKALSNEYTSFESDSFEIGTIDPSGVATAIFDVTIAASCPETAVVEIPFTLTADNGVFVEAKGIMKNTCMVEFVLSDSYGDGWNGSTLTVKFDNGDPDKVIQFADGSTYTETLEIGSGDQVTVFFNAQGYYNDECSYRIRYQDGEEIYNSNGEPNAGLNTTFIVDCGGGSNPDDVFDPVQNLVATVEMNQVTLTWEASALTYVIERNGVVITEQSETTYIDADLLDGVYTYAVIAVYENGKSLPVMVSAEVNTIGVDENTVMFAIYPNPAKDFVNINTNAVKYDYQLINGLGQVVVSGTANGEYQINVSNINKGVYFLKVVADGETRINKLTIQ